MRKSMLVVAIGFAVTLIGATAYSDDPEPPASPWSGSLGLAYLATSGNSDTQTLGLDFGLKRKPEPWGLELAAQFNQASDSGATTAERYLVSGRATRAFSERWQYFIGLSGERDIFAGFDLRTVVETGAQYALLLGPTHTLSVSGGVTYTDENAVDEQLSASYPGGLAGLSYQWQLSDQATLGEKLAYYADFDDTANWRFNSTTSLQSSLTRKLAIKLSYELRYRNQPIGDAKATDTSTSVSLVVNL